MPQEDGNYWRGSTTSLRVNHIDCWPKSFLSGSHALWPTLFHWYSWSKNCKKSIVVMKWSSTWLPGCYATWSIRSSCTWMSRKKMSKRAKSRRFIFVLVSPIDICPAGRKTATALMSSSTRARDSGDVFVPIGPGTAGGIPYTNAKWLHGRGSWLARKKK